MSQFDRVAAAIGLFAILALVWIMSRWVGPDASAVTIDAGFTLLGSLTMALAWVAAAAGFGWPLRRWLAADAETAFAAQVALGVAGMLVVDAALGAFGLLAHRAVAWLVSGAGVGLLAMQLLRMRESPLRLVMPDGIAWACAPAVAVLLIAACSAPGWLWASEFGGYDALSYHLQLPKEWLGLGRIEPLEHNVYAFLPGYVEAAYLHMMAMRGDAMTAAYDCQALHASMTLLSAWMVGTLAARVGGRRVGAIAAALYLATPWVIIVGSLAYNEMAVNLFLAAGTCIASDERIGPLRRGLIIGLLSAAAIGAKLTAIGFVALPLGAVLVCNVAPRRWIGAMGLAALAGFIGLWPYLLRNWAFAGNPVFPFATSAFGAAHWTSEQVATWRSGHISDATVMQRLWALWHQFFAYGVTANPDAKEPWKPQWAALPWLGVVGAIAASLQPVLRRPALHMALVMCLQIAFWLAFTHLKSRFLLPAAVPLSVLAALGLHATLMRASHPAGRMAAAATFIAHAALAVAPLLIYRTEGGGRPAIAIGTVHQQTGDELNDAGRIELGSSQLPAVAVNWLLPAGSRVLLVGEAAPLYFHRDRIAYNTVWDRGPLSRLMREQPEDPEAWRKALREMGFTHLLLNPTMLTIWQRAGWNDPLLTQRDLLDFAERTCEPIFDYPSGITIYAIPLE